MMGWVGGGIDTRRFSRWTPLSYSSFYAAGRHFVNRSIRLYLPLVYGIRTPGLGHVHLPNGSADCSRAPGKWHVAKFWIMPTCS